MRPGQPLDPPNSLRSKPRTVYRAMPFFVHQKNKNCSCNVKCFMCHVYGVHNENFFNFPPTQLKFYFWPFLRK